MDGECPCHCYALPKVSKVKCQEHHPLFALRQSTVPSRPYMAEVLLQSLPPMTDRPTDRPTDRSIQSDHEMYVLCPFNGIFGCVFAFLVWVNERASSTFFSTKNTLCSLCMYSDTVSTVYSATVLCAVPVPLSRPFVPLPLDSL